MTTEPLEPTEPAEPAPGGPPVPEPAATAIDQFELVEFELVIAAPGTALLRVALRPSEPGEHGPLHLLLANDEGEDRLSQLPSLPGTPDIVRAAFSAPAAQVDRATAFGLEFTDGTIAELPTPTLRAAPAQLPVITEERDDTDASGGVAHVRVADVSETFARDPQELASRLSETEGRAEARRLAIIELENRLQAERDRRSTAEAELSRMRSERDEALAVHDAALVELEEARADRDQAEARARAAAANAGSLQAQIRAVEDDVIRTRNGLEAELADRNAELERLRASADAAQARAHTSRRETVALEEQLEHLRSQLSVLERALDERRAEQQAMTPSAREEEIKGLRNEIDGLHDEVELLRAEVADREERLKELFARAADERSKAQAALAIIGATQASGG